MVSHLCGQLLQPTNRCRIDCSSSYMQEESSEVCLFFILPPIRPTIVLILFSKRHVSYLNSTYHPNKIFLISKYKCKQNLCRSCFVIVFYSNFIKVSFYKIVFSIKFFSKGIEISIFFTRNLTSWVASSFKLLTVIY